MVGLSVLVVDDSALYRKILADLFSAMDGIDSVTRAINGKDALARMAEKPVDLVTLDLEMPILDGMATLPQIRARHPDAKVIIVSAYSRSGAEVTMRALEAGAFDFLTKPDFEDLETSQAKLGHRLTAMIQPMLQTRTPQPARPPQGSPPPPPAAVTAMDIRMIRVVGIGISTGGPSALARLLAKLNRNFSRPILVVQHMPPLFTQALAESLDRQSKLEVVEAKSGQTVRAGRVYVAPGGAQMCVDAGDNGEIIRITDDPPEVFCKPSADYLFRSMARIYEGRVMALVMTGMGNDGNRGAQLIKRRGGHVIAQDEASCVVFGMPREVIRQGIASEILSLEEIPNVLNRYFG